MHSFELEQQLIAGIIEHPETYSEVSPFFTSKDFVSDINKTIYSFISNSYERSEVLDAAILSEKISLSGISFEDNIDIGDYLHALTLRRVTKESTISAAKEVKKLSVRRELKEVGGKLSRTMENIGSEKSYIEIINIADEIFNQKISSYENQENSPKNIFTEMAELIEE